MKVVRIIARLNVGGPAKHVVWLTEGLRDDCETILVAGQVPRGEEDMGYFANEMGVKPLYIREMSREISLRDLRAVWKLYRLLWRERPDIVHTHTAKAGTVGRIATLWYRCTTFSILLGRRRACKVVHTYHGHIFHSYYGRFKTRAFLLIEKVLARMATDRVVVVSEQQRAEIHETFGVGRPEQFVVVPLGLDLSCYVDRADRREMLRDEIGATPEEFLVGIVGRLTEIKNHDLFFRAAKLLERNHGNACTRRVRFVVVGEGSLRTRLEDQVAELGLTEDVIFLGHRRDPENFYSALDVVALTSRNEGTPLTLIEAMASARPVIATRVGGVTDLLGKKVSEDESQQYVVYERGVGVSSGDAAAFAEGLARLVSDDQLRRQLGQRGLQFVVKNYSKERLLSDLSGLYHDLLRPELKPAPVPADNGPLTTDH